MASYKTQFQLQEKVALITGAAQGIGAEISRALGELGATVIVSDQDADLAESQVDNLKSAGIQAAFAKLDVTSEQEWQTTMMAIEKEHGHLDILVNNAGIMFYESVEEMSLDKFRLMQSVNVDGVFLGSKYASKLMKKHATAEQRASIVNLSSLAGLAGSSLVSAYCASKGSVRLMTKAMAAEFGADHIRVNSIHPGLIQTDMGDQVQDMLMQKAGLSSREEAQAIGLALTPLQAWGTPSDVASAVAFMASPASNFMTGTEIVVDGGIHNCQ
ncbi:SDR family NAD(P)-dependent oxidoreductase [Pseudoteredinibacter isoporae]|uniref:NAD(P)-dependent dehydrogenase (Short-subunit alcohol dehydrogenase family) n=1 Tax=Pseudoteredinibacter isoporae TaxID=570281 RepID=A0A7X0MUU3_9GAMM|nr:SDR family NAD(P)-dependent oxidoreductase [Pseudoteredinibacter isoporae]MBB6521026.1 NAD(P)-dependent dehydrogenase (short-subunit alcohol dehydrogenase family) [Pseudoteredinibacter isoporae]NHO86590.1 SDR family oxidoreductase [Pseudoteredinibacter isoporae]NIB24958.1 SDR family oxidoreductase [Pseudoteredinibacter isoporae]